MTGIMLSAAWPPTLAKNARMGHPRSDMGKEEQSVEEGGPPAMGWWNRVLNLPDRSRLARSYRLVGRAYLLYCSYISIIRWVVKCYLHTGVSLHFTNGKWRSRHSCNSHPACAVMSYAMFG